MQDEYYIVENAGWTEPEVLPITTMRIVEIASELIHSEVLHDAKGRIPVFRLIDRRSEEQKQGVVVIERKKGHARREYFLQKESMPRGYGVNINGQVYVLKYHATNRNLKKATYREGRLVLEEDGAPKRRERAGKEVEVYPATENTELLQMWSRVERLSPGSEISTRIISLKSSARYIVTVRGKKVVNGVEKDLAVVLLTPSVSAELLLQGIAKYNGYVSTGLKEVVGSPKTRGVDPNYFLQERLIGQPVLGPRHLFLDLVYHLLLEHRVLLVSSDEDIVVNYAQCLLSSLLPYQWKGVLCVPLPACAEYTKLVEATVPYLIGMRGSRSEVQKIARRIPEKTVVAYLDEEKICINSWGPEKKRLINRLYGSAENRKALPFYQSVLRRVDFAWPGLKVEMNVYMEIVNTQVCAAREKFIRDLLRHHRQDDLRSFINGFADFTPELQRYLPEASAFFREFLGTTMYCSGVDSEQVQEVKDEEIEEKDLAAILWICIYASGEVLKKHDPHPHEVQFVIEAFIRQFISASFVTAEALVINLLSVFSALNVYDMVLYVCQVVLRLGAQLTQEMYAAIVPILSESELQDLSHTQFLLSPWTREKATPQDDPIQGAAKESIRDIWKKIPFVGPNLATSLSRYVCTTRESLAEKDPAILRGLLHVFDKYELPH